MKQECKDCNKSLDDCTCIEDTIELPNQALIDVAERLKGKELFKESNDRARKILSEIKSLPIQERMYSEEDMIKFAMFYHTHQGKATKYWGKDLFKEWFEQLKKK